MFRTRFAVVTARIYAAIAAAWLVYLVYLDVTMSMFPRVLIGGIKILVVVTLVVAAAGLVASKLADRMRRRSAAPVLHGTPAE
jgi:TRAP-type C4-dicarboxylate transport system permease large subunit